MSTILNTEPTLDYWIREYDSSGGEHEWGSLEGFLEDMEGYQDTYYINKVLVNLKLFKSPARIQTILSKATSKIPEKFRIILNDIISEDYLGTIKLPDTQMKAIKPLNGVITLVIQPNDDPITAWMISHRIGHVIETYAKHIHKKISVLIDEYVDKFTHIHGASRYTYDRNDEDVYKLKGEYNKLSGFRSAKTNNVNSYYEYINDIIAQYCHIGRIEFITPDLSNIADSSSYKIEKNKIEKEIGDLIKQSLNDFNGRILVV